MAQMTITSFMTGIKNWVLGKIGAITDLIPLQASSSNKLADKAFVNSSIATATATFQGTYNVVSDLSLSYNATHAQIQTALGSAISTADNNDYAFVQIPTADATPTQIAKTEKYKYNGTAWAFEYELNSSGFTAAQWAAINSGATLELIGKLSALPTNAQLIALLDNKVSWTDNGAYDVTAHNSGATFASLSAILNSENLDTLIPIDIRRDGMSIKYVQSSDNKYVQARCMADEFTTDVTQWQGVDENIIPLSKNLAESGGVFKFVDKFLAREEVDNYVFSLIDVKRRLLIGVKSDLKVKWFLEIPDKIQAALDEKVNAEEGKSLINEDIANCFDLVQAKPVLAITDKNGKVFYRILDSNIAEAFLPHTFPSVTILDLLELGNSGNLGINLTSKIKSICNIHQNHIVLKVTSSTDFELHIPNIVTGECIIHGFSHRSYTKDCSEQGGSANLLCGDMLDAVSLMNENRQRIAQPNMNAIYMISAANEDKHVGTGGGDGGSHGCEVRDYTYILLDGKKYTLEEILALQEDVICSSVQILQKSHTYKVDASRSPTNAENTPAIENGEPVISTDHYMHVTYSVDNYIEWRNKITIRRDNIKFAQLNMGMLAGFYPYFSEGILNDDKNSHFTFEKVSGEMVVTPIPVSNTVRGQWLEADELTIFGGRYSIRQRLRCDDADRQKNSFIYSVTQDSDNRFKSYFNPIRTVSVSSPETFNTGDVIAVTNVRKIDINNNI